MNVTTPTDREIVIATRFAAPRRLVFDAHTKPELLKRWFGPHGWRLAVCEIDLRPGGTWHYLMRGPGEAEMALRGTYLEIAAPERLVTTESNVDCDARAEHESLTTLELTEDDRGTLLTNTVRFPSREIRDAVLASGTARGVGQGFERLAGLLAAEATATPEVPARR